MPPPDPNAPPESVVLGVFSGIHNTVTRERLTSAELEIARNVDIDEAGQVRRRRGYTRKDSASWHSIKGPIAGKVFGARNGILGIIRADYSFTSLASVGDGRVCYTEVAGDTYFSSPTAAGVITNEEEVLPWGHTAGQDTWLSPVLQPTDTLGEISGKLLGDPPRAIEIEAYSGRIYLAAGKTLWATELYQYHYVDKTKNYIQFEDEITLLSSVNDGLVIGTTAGVFFLSGVLGRFKLHQLTSNGALPGSLVKVPAALIHPQIRKSPVPENIACTFMTNGGVLVVFDGGECYNLTQGYGEEWNRVIFPEATSAAALYRQDIGDNTYVAVLDSAGGPTANTRIGDFVDAEIIRASERGA